MYNEVRVFAENKPGKLSKISTILGEAGVDIVNLELDDEGQYGVFKILTPDPEGARQALSDANLPVAFNCVAVIEIPDQPGGLVQLAKALEATELNVTDAYGCILERGKRAIFVVKGDNLEKIESAAQAAGLKALDKLE